MTQIMVRFASSGPFKKLTEKSFLRGILNHWKSRNTPKERSLMIKISRIVVGVELLIADRCGDHIEDKEAEVQIILILIRLTTSSIKSEMVLNTLHNHKHFNIIMLEAGVTISVEANTAAEVTSEGGGVLGSIEIILISFFQIKFQSRN